MLREAGLYLTGTADSTVDTTSVTDATLGYLSAQEKVGHWLYIPTSTGGGTAITRESRKISVFAPATGDFTVATAFSGIPQTADVFYVMPWTHDEIETALNNAIVRAGLRAITIDTSLTTAANTYKYTVPTARQGDDLYRVEIQGSPSDVYAGIKRWKRNNATDLVLYSQYTSGKTIRTWYRGNYTAYATEAASWAITDEEALLVCAWAIVELTRLLYQRSRGQTKDDIRQEIEMWINVAMDRQRRYTPKLDDNTQLIRSWLA